MHCYAKLRKGIRYKFRKILTFGNKQNCVFQGVCKSFSAWNYHNGDLLCVWLSVLGKSVGFALIALRSNSSSLLLHSIHCNFGFARESLPQRGIKLMKRDFCTHPPNTVTIRTQWDHPFSLNCKKAVPSYTQPQDTQRQKMKSSCQEAEQLYNLTKNCYNIDVPNP